MSGFHRDITGDQNHVIHFREYANKDDREAAVALDATHLHKVALQQDDNTLWMLVNTNPVEWQAVGGSGGGHFSGEIVMFWGVINSEGRPLNVITGEPDFAWGYCDGRTYSAPDGRQVTTPDMRDRFPMSAGGDGAGKGDIGGAASITQSTAQMKAHSHTLAGYAKGSYTSLTDNGSKDAVWTTKRTSTVGGATAMENRPPFIKIPFIMYL